jgi:hypothetical protein
MEASRAALVAAPISHYWMSDRRSPFGSSACDKVADPSCSRRPGRKSRHSIGAAERSRCRAAISHRPLRAHVSFRRIPQLLNMLVGDMSLIGPRPLLPRDQPPNCRFAQALLAGLRSTVAIPCAEKDALDEWYIRNASWQLERIIFMTLV